MLRFDHPLSARAPVLALLVVSLSLSGCVGQAATAPVAPTTTPSPPAGAAQSPQPAAGVSPTAVARLAPLTTPGSPAGGPSATEAAGPSTSFTATPPATPSATAVATQVETPTQPAVQPPVPPSPTPTREATPTAAPTVVPTERAGSLASPPPVRPFPIVKESKLGIGVYASGGHIMNALQVAEPGAILIQEPKVEFAQELRRNFPAAFIVGKRFRTDGQLLDNPRARGIAYADFVAELAVPLKGVVDAWQSYNEPIPGGNPALYAAYNEFQVAFADRLQGHYGISAVAGNDPPGAFQPEDYPTYFADALRAIDYLGLHVYGSGERPWRLNEPAAEWYILRYRKVHQALENAGITGVRIVLTETGHGFGWRGKLNEEQVAEDFIWLARETERDPYLVGQMIFGLFGDGNWPEYDLTLGILDRLRAYQPGPPG